jgi:4-diphosphocytidyl-2-C-methyl-D-erythritol kinase
VTLFESVSLADEVTVTLAEADADQVVCAGVNGLNIVTQTLDGLRARGWDGAALRVAIDKRIPVAGGMGGGSADAAAVLRLAAAVGPDPGLSAIAVGELACALGADVPSQLTPGLSLGTGAGDVVEILGDPLAPHAFVIVPQDFGLSTADVYREADRLGLPRDAGALAAR